MNLFKNFITTLRRYKTASLLNLLGLVVAFSAFTIIMIQVRYDLTFNRSYRDCERIYRIELSGIFENDHYAAVLPRPLGEKMIASSPDIEAGGLVNDWGETRRIYDAEQGEAVAFDEVPYLRISPATLDILDYRCVAGSFERFAAANTVILPQSLARKLYGETNPTGQMLVMKDEQPREIIAVYADFPANCFLRNGVVTTIGNTDLNRPDSWGYSYYVKLNRTDNRAKAEAAILSLFEEIANGQKAGVRLTPVPDIYFNTDTEWDGTPKGSRTTTCSLLLVAVLILSIAAINFINFSVALVPLRIRSINTQKVFGCPTAQLRGSQITQAALTMQVGFLLSIGAIHLFATSRLASLVSADLHPAANIPLLCATGAVALAVGIIAGLYPAWYSTSFPPALVLKGSFGLSPKGRRIRTALIAFQYFIALALILVAISIRMQNHFMQQHDMGFVRSNILTARITNGAASHRERLVAKLKSHPAISEITFASQFPVAPQWACWGETREGKQIIIDCYYAQANLPQFFGIKIIEGRDFRESDIEQPKDALMIINETAHREYGFKVGDRFKRAEIIGIASDFNSRPMQYGIQPFGFVNESRSDLSGQTCMMVKTTVTDPGPVIAFIRGAIREADPQADTDVQFLDAGIGKLYEKESNLATLLSWFSILAVVIALIGVFGLVLFENQYRRREIAIRRVNGATIPEILMMFNRGFVRIVLICFVVAVPVAWYVIDRYLENFAYKMSIPLWMPFVALALVLLITMLTVTIQTYRAATENPAKAIKTE